MHLIPPPATALLTTAFTLLLSGTVAAARVPRTPNFAALAGAEEQQTIASRRWMHAHPELSLREFQTRKWLREQLSAIPGLELIEGDWGTGLAAILRGASPGPLVAYRADFDGLPVREDTGLSFASTASDTLGEQTVGVMHACGHDLHTAMLLSTARILASLRDRMHGAVLFILEPAEEVGAGAQAFIQNGLFDRLGKPVAIYAIHDHPTLLSGQVGYCPERAAANVDDFYIRVLGRGGHGAYPHKAVDPVVVACEMVIAFQSIVSREIDTEKSAVITVGSIQGGTSSNVIPDAVELRGTARSFEPEIREQLHAAILRTAKGIAAARGAPEPEIRYGFGTPSMYNDPKLVEEPLPVLRRVVGEENVIRYGAGMGGEDFSYFEQVLPGFMFRLGVGRKNREMSLHSATFDPDEAAMPIGVRLMCEVLWDRLERG